MHAMFLTSRFAACVLAAVALSTTAHAASGQLSELLNPPVNRSNVAGEGADGEKKRISLVRETILRDTATVLGARAGLTERSRELMQIIDRRATGLDAKYAFGRLVIGNNVLPPVISESREVVSLEAAVMRVAGVVYRIDEPARFALPTPTWRNYLYLGLDETSSGAQDLLKKVGAGNLPQNDEEKNFWQQTIKTAYESGRKHADDLFDSNLARLDRDYYGMERYFELWKRGMVTAPVLSSAHEVLQREDANTIAVGNTIFQINAGSDFTEPAQWTPLE